MNTKGNQHQTSERKLEERKTTVQTDPHTFSEPFTFTVYDTQFTTCHHPNAITPNTDVACFSFCQSCQYMVQQRQPQQRMGGKELMVWATIALKCGSPSRRH